MLAGIMGLILVVVGVIAAVFALASKELEQNKMMKYSVIAALLALTLYAAIGSIYAFSITEIKTSTDKEIVPTDSPSISQSNNPQTSVEKTVYVSASVYPFINTNIELQAGDIVEIIVENQDANWDCTGYGDYMGPQGKLNDKANNSLMPSANFCELIGYYVSEEELFRVGFYTKFNTRKTGYLYLGSNDAICSPQQCYDDNKGVLPVTVRITRKT